MNKEREKLRLVLGGIRKMGGLPNLLFVIDVVKERTAIEEAKKLGIPVVAIVDTNADPDTVDFVIPANDDAIKAIKLYCQLASNAVLEGLAAEANSLSEDIGSNPNLEVKLDVEAEVASEAEAK
jgi:small subunit ribosomal protein S2